MTRASVGHRRSPTYDEFIQKVRAYRTSDVIRGLASLPADTSDADKGAELWRHLSPWGIAVIAREALVRGNEHRPSRTVGRDEILRLHNFFGASHDEPHTGDGDPHSVLGILTRIAYEQFLYQESDFEEIARTVALFRDTAGTSEDGLWVRNRLQAGFGANIDDLVSAGCLIYAAVRSNNGHWDPSLLKDPGLQSLLAVVPGELVIQLADRMTVDQQGFRAAFEAVPEPSLRPLRRWGFNPLVATPLIRISTGEVLAPQPRLILGRFTPAGLYYDGWRLVGDGFSSRLGSVVEDYVGRQLAVVAEAQVFPEIIWGKQERRSVDWFLVTPHCVVLIEVKSTRPTIGIRAGDSHLVEAIQTSINRARGQINQTEVEIMGGNPAFAHIPLDRPHIGLIVTAEPFYTGNSPWMRDHLVDTAIPVMVSSLRDLESLVPRSASDLGSALVSISRDTELRTWPMFSAAARFVEHRENPILQAAGDSVPLFRWGHGATGDS